VKAFLLAAGFGERLRPLTEKVPKPLIPVADIPSICYALYILKRSGVTDIVCNIHYLGDRVVEFFNDHDNFGFNVTFSKEDEILGTGGGLKKCEELLDDDFVLINSDILIDLDLTAAIEQYQAEKLPGLIIVKEVVKEEATVSIDGNRVVDFKNSMKSGMAPLYDYTGAAVFSPEIFPLLETGFSSVVYTGYTGLIADKGLSYFVHHGTWIDIGTPESLDTAAELLVTGMPEFLRAVREFYAEYNK